MSPLVSILMPVYNAALYLEEAIKSVLNQSFSDFELIVLNDGSTDDSLTITQQFANNDARIIIYNGEQNMGIANVLNIGLGIARGQLIARMDSDDISLPNRFSVQVQYMMEHPDVDLCSCGMKQFGESDKLMFYDNSNEEIKFNAMFFSPILHPTVLWRRDKMKSFSYEQEYVPAEDYRLWTKALVNNVSMVNIPDILYLYRIHVTQATQQTERVNIAVEKVRTEYIKMMFPLISQQEQKLLLDIPSCNDVNVLKESLDIWKRWNDKTAFIAPDFLKEKLKRYYQARLYNEMKENGIIWSKLCSLRFKQIIKLFGCI